MAETEVRYGLKIEWERPLPPPPIPVRVHAVGEPLWGKRLDPFRSRPGVSARIMRGYTTGKKAANQKVNILRSMEKVDPYDRWKIQCLKELDGTWGIWCTYEGRMTESEYLERCRRRAEHTARIRTVAARNEARSARRLQRSAISASLRPPTLEDSELG